MYSLAPILTFFAVAIIGAAMNSELPRKTATQTFEAEYRILCCADFENVPPTYPQINPDDYERERLVHNLNKLGKEGWELCGSTEPVLMFRKHKPIRRWQYAAVPIHKSLSENKPKGAASLHESIKSLQRDRWEPCGFWGKVDTLIVMQPLTTRTEPK